MNEDSLEVLLHEIYYKQVYVTKDTVSMYHQLPTFRINKTAGRAVTTTVLSPRYYCNGPGN